MENRQIEGIVNKIRERELTEKKAYFEDRAAFTDGVQLSIRVIQEESATAVNNHDELVEALSKLVNGHDNDTLSWASWLNAKEILSKLSPVPVKEQGDETTR